jgi:hypothetical protein
MVEDMLSTLKMRSHDNSVPATMMGDQVYNETSTTSTLNKKHHNLLAKVISQRTVQLIGN